MTYGGADEYRGTEDFDVEQFIAVKGYKAKGKRLTTYQIESIVELEPTRFPEPEPEPEQEPETPESSESSENSEVPQPLSEQPSLFSDEDF